VGVFESAREANRGTVESWRGSTLRASGTWRSLVAHLLWEQGVASSNLAVPIRKGLGDKAFLLVGHWAQPVCEEPDGKLVESSDPAYERGEAAGIEPANDLNRLERHVLSRLRVSDGARIGHRHAACEL
jgi:hypothetical protein